MTSSLPPPSSLPAHFARGVMALLLQDLVEAERAAKLGKKGGKKKSKKKKGKKVGGRRGACAGFGDGWGASQALQPEEVHRARMIIVAA